MILKIENPMTREQWRNATTDEKVAAYKKMADLWIEKYNETKASVCLIRARRYRTLAQLVTATGAGLFASRSMRHYEKGDFEKYLDDVRNTVAQLVEATTELCVKSREHGYSFNPARVNVYNLIRMMANGSVSRQYGEPSADDKEEFLPVADGSGEMGLF